MQGTTGWGRSFSLWPISVLQRRNVFYNAFLPEISNEQNIGRISGLGWALGYIGGGALLAINLIMLKYPESIGFPKGLFYGPGLFSLCGRLVADLFGSHFSLFDARGRRGSVIFQGGLLSRRVTAGSGQTFSRIKTFRELTKFLIAFLIYNDGIETVIVMASIFGAERAGDGDR